MTFDKLLKRTKYHIILICYKKNLFDKDCRMKLKLQQMFRTSRNFSTQKHQSKQIAQVKFRSSNSLRKQSISNTIFPQKVAANNPNNSNMFKQTEHPVAIKDFIDNYFKDEFYLNCKMPIIQKRRTSQKVQNERLADRRSRYVNRIEEKCSKSVIDQNRKYLSQDHELPPQPVLRCSVSSTQHQLPSIHEQTQGPEQQQELNQVLNITSKGSFPRKSSSLFSNLQNIQVGQGRICTFENELFVISIITRNGKPLARVKQYKENGLLVMEREQKMRCYQVKTLWKESKYNPYSFTMSPIPPIKDLILKIMPDQACSCQHKIKPNSLHSKLLANHCQQLCMLLRNLCLQLKNIEGKVLNNKINPSNLFLISNELHLSQWGCSSFRDEFIIRDNRFQKRKYGVLKGDKDWFVSPQYLAPEIIRQILGEVEEDIWQDKGSPDIWSLGLTFFEFLTLIPIWMSQKCSLINRTSTLRRGILFSPNRELHFLLKKQMNVQKVIKRLLYSQVAPQDQNETLFDILIRMVEPNSSKRISIDEIIQLL